MNENKKNHIIKIVIIATFIGIPIIVMFFNLGAGGFLLIFGGYFAYRAIRSLSGYSLQFDERNQFHNINATGKNILVQIVDDFGRELPPNEVEKRLAEARAKADPRDNVIGVNFKVESNQEQISTKTNNE